MLAATSADNCTTPRFLTQNERATLEADSNATGPTACRDLLVKWSDSSLSVDALLDAVSDA
jgi:hypothetical protein